MEAQKAKEKEDELIQQGKALLLEQYETMMAELDRREQIANWKRRREALTEKRNVLLRADLENLVMPDLPAEKSKPKAWSEGPAGLIYPEDESRM